MLNYAMKTYGGMVVLLQESLMALDRGDWSASRPGHFTPGKESNGAHWIADWVGPTVGTADRRTLLLSGIEPWSCCPTL
jgi:hypothetical protein